MDSTGEIPRVGDMVRAPDTEGHWRKGRISEVKDVLFAGGTVTMYRVRFAMGSGRWISRSELK